MPISHRETRSQTVKIHFNDPSSTREWIVWGSRNRDEILAHLTFFNLPPLVDTVANIPRYLRDADLNETGNGVWKYKANYCKDPNTVTVEVNYTGGTKKMLHSLEMVRSYNCLTSVGTQTADKIPEANDAVIAVDAANQLDTSIPLANSDATIAYNMTVVAGVASVVALYTAQAAGKTENAANHGFTVSQARIAIVGALNNAINAAQISNSTACSAAATQAATIATNAATAATAAIAAAGLAVFAADDASVAASGLGGTENDDAQNAAQNAAGKATIVAGDAVAVKNLIQAAATAAQDLANAVIADTASHVPDIGTMINVTDKGVDGVEIEDEKCDITITKHFVISTLTSDFLKTLQGMSPSKNNAEFAINYKGQIILYKAGELKFKNFTYKQEGDDSVDVTYYLAYSRNITEADNQVVGNSPPIVKEGWDYISIFYEDYPDETAFCKSKRPRAVYIHKVYKAADFSKLQLGI